MRVARSGANIAKVMTAIGPVIREFDPPDVLMGLIAFVIIAQKPDISMEDLSNLILQASEFISFSLDALEASEAQLEGAEETLPKEKLN